MDDLTTAQREANLLSTVRIAIQELRGADYQIRRRGVIYMATILGHKIGSQLRDQEWGVVAECINCGCVAKAAKAGDSIEGRATTTFCPATRAVLSGGWATSRA